MNRSVISKKDQVKISELFERMGDSPGKDSNKSAMDWLKTHNNSFSGFIDNKFLDKTTEEKYYKINFSDVDVELSVGLKEKLRDAFLNFKKKGDIWYNLQSFERSPYLYRIAETIEKNSELFAQVEALSTGKHLYRTKTKDVPNLIQSFNYYASVTENSQYFTEGDTKGVVCVVAEEHNFPLLSVSWRVASILAAGNAVLLLVDVHSCLSAFLLAELCSLSGLPAGVLNVLPHVCFPDDILLPDAIKVIVTGQESKIRHLVNSGAACEMLVSQRPIAIVYENADLHSAANGVFEMVYFNNKRSCSIYVQESIKEKFYSLLEENASKVRTSVNFTKTQPSYSTALTQLQLFLDEARQQKLKVIEGHDVEPSLIFDVPTTSKLLEKSIPLPLIFTTPFRTAKESIAMFNHNKLGSDVSIWTEKLPLALEVVQKLRTRTIWINTQNMFDASIPYGGLWLSGTSIEGGIEALFANVNQLGKLPSQSNELVDSYGKETPVGITLKNCPEIKFNYDLHIGGSYKKPSGGMYTIAKNKEQAPYAYIGLGTSGDIQAAVSSAVTVQPKWQNLSKFKRIKILRKAANALASKKNELISLLSDIAGLDAKEIDESISKLHYWSNNMKYPDGQVIETESCCKVFQEHNPLGVIGIQVSNVKPLLSFVSTAIPAIACGNAVVAILDGEISSMLVFKLCEILQSCGVLGGTVNAVTGCHKHLTRHLALNLSVDSVWYSRPDAAHFLHKSCIDQPKRIFYYKLPCKDNYLLSECTFVKSVYMPQGDIFAN